jgi:hypothetical protein
MATDAAQTIVAVDTENVREYQGIPLMSLIKESLNLSLPANTRTKVSPTAMRQIFEFMVLENGMIMTDIDVGFSVVSSGPDIGIYAVSKKAKPSLVVVFIGIGLAEVF